MKTIFISVMIALALVLMLLADVPWLFEQLVPEAHAVLGVRRRTARRTAVVVGSAASAQTAAAQQQAAAAEKEAAAAQQQAAIAQQQAAQAAAAVPVGTVAPSLPGGCQSLVVIRAQSCYAASEAEPGIAGSNSSVHVSECR